MWASNGSDRVGHVGGRCSAGGGCPLLRELEWDEVGGDFEKFNRPSPVGSLSQLSSLRDESCSPRTIVLNCTTR
jgi:hypothetical protein